MEQTKKNDTSAFIIVTVLFFLWGFITVLVDSLIPRLKDVFELSNFQAVLVQLAFFGAYFVFSVPAGWLLSKIGYQKGIVLGLAVMALGCVLFSPAASERMFGIFILGYFTLAAGITILQVAANPYVAVLGAEDGASSRLNLSQAFNSLGTTIAPIIGASFLLSDTIMSSDAIAGLSENAQQEYYNAEAAAVSSPFLMLALCIGVLALLFIFIKLPKILEKSPEGGYAKLFSNKLALMGVAGIFLYVGAEVAIGSFLVLYFLDMNLAAILMENDFMNSIATNMLNTELSEVDPKAIVGSFVFLYWGGAMLGRFVGAYLTRVIKPGKVLAIFAGLAVSMIVISMSSSGLLAMWSILAVGLFNSIMFPTIFTLTLDGLGDLKPQASGLLCMAIVGGAIIPPIYGALADGIGYKSAFILVIACYSYILYFGYKKQKEIVIG
ncbi:MAG: FHS family L-fucose permease-like MFS transporter [Planctomycetota bacterium]|jgi:FHS family L-fucose permease-like MFS transporter|uniref:sugar MFS transporter n=1 Tax=Patiriisocius sp. Uisw_047 TaxID=3230969 RepID=UPI0039EC44E3